MMMLYGYEMVWHTLSQMVETNQTLWWLRVVTGGTDQSEGQSPWSFDLPTTARVELLIVNLLGHMIQSVYQLGNHITN